jgi:hypothetical protein
MSTQTQPRSAAPRDPTSARSGWVWFASLYIGFAGAMNLLWGINALANRDYFNEEGLVWSTLDLWGGIALFIAAIQLTAAVFLYARKSAGMIMALVIAPLAMLNAFSTLGAYPGWSAAALVANTLVLWAVTAHGDEFA